MELETFLEKLNDIQCNEEDYTVTCNKILGNPLVLIKEDTGKIVEAINLKGD